MCLSHLLPEDLNFHFRGSLNIFAKVISEDGNEFVAFDDSTSVSRHLVDIEFTEDTREHFKPGIPFNGKVKILLHASLKYVFVLDLSEISNIK